MTIQIIGAGMAGLLAAEQLRRQRPLIREAQQSLPDNHGALLRFRSDAVARETKQTFLRVPVFKGIKSGGRVRTTASLRDINQYSLKVAGTIAARSVINLEPCERYIAPPDFLAALARDKTIEYGVPFTRDDLAALRDQRDITTISTIPMPVLMNLAGWHCDPEDFSWRSIYSVVCTLNHLRVNVYQTIYYPDPKLPFYRASITGDQLIIEYLSDLPPDLGYISDVCDDFGIPIPQRGISTPRIKHQRYGKLLAADAHKRQEFILAMTDRYNLYSVGRFATWRQLLLDDVVHDMHLVARMIQERSSYTRKLNLFPEANV